MDKRTLATKIYYWYKNSFSEKNSHLRTTYLETATLRLRYIDNTLPLDTMVKLTRSISTYTNETPTQFIKGVEDLNYI